MLKSAFQLFNFYLLKLVLHHYLDERTTSGTSPVFLSHLDNESLYLDFTVSFSKSFPPILFIFQDHSLLSLMLSGSAVFSPVESPPTFSYYKTLR